MTMQSFFHSTLCALALALSVPAAAQSDNDAPVSQAQFREFKEGLPAMMREAVRDVLNDELDKRQYVTRPELREAVREVVGEEMERRGVVTETTLRRAIGEELEKRQVAVRPELASAIGGELKRSGVATRSEVTEIVRAEIAASGFATKWDLLLAVLFLVFGSLLKPFFQKIGAKWFSGLFGALVLAVSLTTDSVAAEPVLSTNSEASNRMQIECVQHQEPPDYVPVSHNYTAPNDQIPGAGVRGAENWARPVNV